MATTKIYPSASLHTFLKSWTQTREKTLHSVLNSVCTLVCIATTSTSDTLFIARFGLIFELNSTESGCLISWGHEIIYQSLTKKRNRHLGTSISLKELNKRKTFLIKDTKCWQYNVCDGKLKLYVKFYQRLFFTTEFRLKNMLSLATNQKQTSSFS